MTPLHSEVEREREEVARYLVARYLEDVGNRLQECGAVSVGTVRSEILLRAASFLREPGRVRLPKKRADRMTVGKHIGLGFNEGWDECLDEVIRLNRNRRKGGANVS